MVFFLGSPALHNAGTDRLQMVGVRSLHFDRAWFLVFSSSVIRQMWPSPKQLLPMVSEKRPAEERRTKNIEHHWKIVQLIK